MKTDSKNNNTSTETNNVLAVRFISENIIVDRFPIVKEIKAGVKHSVTLSFCVGRHHN